jgi:hypothetical protein
MAVQKRTSQKTNKRKTVWKRIALKQSVKAYSLYSIAVKELQMETADVSLDQNRKEIHLRRITFIVNQSF